MMWADWCTEKVSLMCTVTQRTAALSSALFLKELQHMLLANHIGAVAFSFVREVMPWCARCQFAVDIACVQAICSAVMFLWMLFTYECVPSMLFCVCNACTCFYFFHQFFQFRADLRLCLLCRGLAPRGTGCWFELVLTAARFLLVWITVSATPSMHICFFISLLAFPVRCCICGAFRLL